MSTVPISQFYVGISTVWCYFFIFLTTWLIFSQSVQSIIRKWWSRIKLGLDIFSCFNEHMRCLKAAFSNSSCLILKMFDDLKQISVTTKAKIKNEHFFSRSSFWWHWFWCPRGGNRSFHCPSINFVVFFIFIWLTSRRSQWQTSVVYFVFTFTT